MACCRSYLASCEINTVILHDASIITIIYSVVSCYRYRQICLRYCIMFLNIYTEHLQRLVFLSQCGNNQTWHKRGSTGNKGAKPGDSVMEPQGPVA